MKTQNRPHVDLEDTEGKTAYVEYDMFANEYYPSLAW